MLGLAQPLSLPVSPTAYEGDHRDEAFALVVFVGRTECRSLRWLKKGFRHCFVALRANDKWIICDSLKDRMKFSIVELPASFNLSQFYRESGHIVMAGESSAQNRGSWIIPEPMTCVTVVKRILGIRSFWTMTPWQLFCLLNAMNGQWRWVR